MTTAAVEHGEQTEYLEAEDAVRYVAAWRHTNQEAIEAGAEPDREPVYETVPFDEWARTEGFMAAAEAAATHANAKLGVDDVGGGITSTVAGEDLAPIVSVQRVLDRDGDVVSEASVGFDELVAVTPATVDVTVRLDGHSVQLQAPIYARFSVIQQT